MSARVLVVDDSPTIRKVVASILRTRSYEPVLAEKGMRISGRSPDGKFVEIAELPGHPWFVAVQFHPEFQSRPLKPHPLFASFVEASKHHKAGADGQAAVRVTKSEA